MSEVEKIFQEMPKRYVAGKVEKDLIYYFSVGADKWTVYVKPDACEAKKGKLSDAADCVVKIDPKLFTDMVLRGKRPGMMDIARGKIKTNNQPLLLKMVQFFGVNG